MRNVELYIDNKRVDLHKDESILITDKIQDVKDLSKLFTAFSNQFSVPASTPNNLIFKHYYNQQLVNGFDARFKLDAIIKIDGIDFKKGKVVLTNVVMHNRVPKDYKLVFYGNGVNIKDSFKKDKLSSLANTSTLSNLNVENWGISAVKDLLTKNSDNAFSGDIAIPFISSYSNYFIDSSHTSSDDKLIEDSRLLNYNDSSEGNGILIEDLRPAVKVRKVVEAIEEKYDVNFTGQFFDTDEFDELYVHCNQSEGKLELRGSDAITDPVRYSDSEYVSGDDLFTNTYSRLDFPSFGDTIGRAGRISNTDVTIKNIVGLSADESFTIIFSSLDTANQRNIEYYRKTIQYSGSGNITFSWDYPTYHNLVNHRYLDIQFETNAAFDCDLDLDITLEGREGLGIFGSGTPSSQFVTGLYSKFFSIQGGSADLGFVIGEHLPDMKVTDFLNGLFKLYNLAVEVQDNGDIKVNSFAQYYTDGTTIDITQYVDTNNEGISRANLYNRIEYKFKDNDTLIRSKRQQLLGELYGNLKVDSDFFGDEFAYSGSDKEVEVPFSKMTYERLNDLEDNSLTDITYGWGADLTYKPVKVGASLLFIQNTPNQLLPIDDNANSVGTTPTYVIDSIAENSSTINLSTYNRASNFLDEASVNFSNEINEHTLTTENVSIYSRYHDFLISNLYNPQTRLLRLTAYLPLSVLYKLKLNDTLVYSGQRYLINSVKYNVTGNKTELELISRNFTTIDIPIINLDTTPPVLTLLGANPHTVDQDSTYVQQGATATDDVDGGLSNQITYTTDLDMSTIGTYSQVYSVTDSSGNTTTATRTIIVQGDTTPPQFQTASVAINLVNGMSGSSVGNFLINAQDNVGVTNMIFKMNGTTKYNAAPTSGTPGFNQQASVFVTGIPIGGNVTFELIAYDAAGNSNTISRVINNSNVSE